MHIKKNLAIAAAVAVLAVPALGTTMASHTTTANAANVTRQGIFPKNDPRNAIPVGVDHTFTKNGYTFNVKTIEQQEKENGAHGDLDPIITGINGNNNVSNSQVIAALNDKSNLNNKANNEEDTTSNRDNQSNSNNGKLAQTGESNTGAKAGIVGAIAAMVSVAFAGVEKFFKRA